MSELVNDGISLSKGPAVDMYLNAIRDWRFCLEALCEAFRSSLGDTYKSYERDATPEMLDLLFTSKKFRREAVHRMRNASVTRMLSADPQFVRASLVNLSSLFISLASLSCLNVLASSLATRSASEIMKG